MIELYNNTSSKIITLTTLSRANVGKIFSAEYNEKCRKCRLYRVCIGNLRKGMAYRVIYVRNKKHFCPIIKDYMKVVEVIELPFDLTVPIKQAVNGAIITFSKKCNKIDCDNFDVCNPPGLRKGDKIKILKVRNIRIKCPFKINLRVVSAKRIF